MAINYRKCLQCGARKSVPIVYGYPAPELMEDHEKGIVELGGCCIWEGQPDYSCKSCGHQWSRQEAKEAAYQKIQQMKASVGGYFGEYYEININFVSRQLTWQHALYTTEPAFSKRLHASTLHKLREELLMINLLNWKSKYEDPNILDGTQWAVEIIRNGRMIRKYGSNAYPKEWDQFCCIISQIAGKPFR